MLSDPLKTEIRSLSDLHKCFTDQQVLIVKDLELHPALNPRTLEIACEYLHFKARAQNDSINLVAQLCKGGVVTNSSRASKLILEMLFHPDSVNYLTAIVGQQLTASECLAHMIKPSASLAALENSPDLARVIFNFSQHFRGGELYLEGNVARVFPTIPPYSALILGSGVLFGVDQVKSGDRVLLETSWICTPNEL